MLAHWGWPQFVYAALVCVGIGYQIAMHGKPRSPHDAVSGFIATALVVWLLYMGGFWS